MKPVNVMIEMEATGRNIRRIMTQRGIRVRDVQKACGFEQPQAVYKWLRGQSLPSVDNLVILSIILHTSIEGILVTNEDALPVFMDDAEEKRLAA